MGTETQRHMEFHSDLREQLFVRHFVGIEELGDCFEYTVTLYSKSAEVKLEELLGKSVTVEVRMGDFPEPRFFNGIVCEFSYLGVEETHVLYSVVMRPWLWLLSQTRGCEVFQNMSALDIARDLFGKGTGDKPATAKRAETRSSIAVFDDGRLFPKPPSREYCVQYRESDLDFLHRLFEEEGIYYYFTHELGMHTLVLGESIASHDSVPGCTEIEFGRFANEKRRQTGQFYEWAVTKRVRTGIVKLKDYDYQKSLAPLEVDRSHPKDHPNNKWEIYNYPGRYRENDPGSRVAQVRLEESHATHEVARGMTDCTRLFAGALFMLKHRDRKDQSREYLLVGARYDIDSGSFHSGGAGSVYMTTHVTAIPSEVQFRPARTTPRPFVAGPQTAKVVGPKEQVFWTDELARVKIQFAWDRDGKFDENSSCFVRVSQAWAGAGFGGLHVPRIGQEVLVGFIDGDLDRPVVIGRVYNDQNVPAKEYGLPDGATKSGIKSQTVKGAPTSYNELRFDDKKGQEEVFLRAERNLKTRVRSDSSTKIGHTHTHTVKKDINVRVEEGEYTVEVAKGRMFTEVPEAEFQVNSKYITGNATEDVTLVVGACKIFMDNTKIVLTAGTNTITLDAALGIDIKGMPFVRINS